MLGALWTVVALSSVSCARQRESAPPASAIGQNSASCRECHAAAHTAWTGTDHALANRVVDRIADAPALAAFAEATAAAPVAPPDFVLGHKPLRQFLVPAPGRRWQAHELAFDPAKGDVFNVFGAEQRQAGEWGHWSGRGMNWNSMCAPCHMTGYRKNYDAATDSYRSTWVEHGVGCIQCHGAMPSGHGLGPKPLLQPAPTAAELQARRVAAMHTCAPCHARNEPLTVRFVPGENYFDHYRVTLPVERGMFWPDGQQRDEDFNWTSVLLSRMGHAGVTCSDCHEPHSTKTLLPAATNALCQQCHAAPGRKMPVSGVAAPPIDPLAHSHHKDGSAGNACIACHMPTTNYMQRAPRHDHGWLKPDPLLTRELGIPNACSKCHADQPLAWSIDAAEKWYGAKLDSRQRARARAVAAAQDGRADGAERLLALLADEDIPAWKATFLQLLSHTPADPARVAAAARPALRDASPLVRSAAVGLLASLSEDPATLRPLLADPVRLVRLDAALALSGTLAPDAPARRELDAYLALALDQPLGRLRLGMDWANRGDPIEAERQMRQAIAWDPFSSGLFEAYGTLLLNLGRVDEAAAEFYRAATLGVGNADLAFRAALAFAQTGKMTEAENALRFAVARDPGLHRAWYNLGLLLAGAGRLAEAVEALREAETLAPDVADYPYARATLHLRQRDMPAARAAAERSRTLAPDYAPARELLRELERGRLPR